MVVGKLCTWIQVNDWLYIKTKKTDVADESIEVIECHLSDSKPFFVTDGLKLYTEPLLKNKESCGIL